MVQDMGQVRRVYPRNADYQKFEVLKTNRNKRYKYGEFFVEGVRNINEAVKNGWEIASFLYCPEKISSDWARGMLDKVRTSVNYELTSQLMGELSGKADTSELLAVVKMRQDSFSQLKARENPFIVLFDRASNRGNLGTMIRSCDGLGADGLILTGHAVDLYDPEVVTASMGSFFNLPVIRIGDNAAVFSFIEKMKNEYRGFQTIGTTAHRQHPIYGQNLKGPLMLMVGNETEGLCHSFQESCDRLCTIPMAESSSASSFNVACAATVMMYEVMRQRAGTQIDNQMKGCNL